MFPIPGWVELSAVRLCHLSLFSLQNLANMTVQQTLQQFIQQPRNLQKNVNWRLSVKTISEQKHIFVFGAPRSGTTLVKLILGAHSQLSGPGYETGIFMYKDIFQFNFGGFSSAELAEMRAESKDIVDFFDNFAEANLQKTSGKYFIEKTPPHVLRLAFLSQHFPNARFINVVRDGRDCFCSAVHHPNVVQGSSVERYAKYWKRCIRARLKRGEQSNIFDLKYEDLVANPEQQIRTVMDFLGEEYQTAQLNPQSYSHNQITQTSKPHFSKLGKPITNSSQQRWKQELSPRDVGLFEAIAGAELEAMGYSLSRQVAA